MGQEDSAGRKIRREHVVLIVVALLIVAAIVVFIFCWPAITGTVNQPADDLAKVELAEGGPANS